MKRIDKNAVQFKVNKMRYGQRTYSITHEIVKTEQKKIITEMKPNRAILIYGTFHISNMSMNEEQYLSFNDEVKRNIEEGKAVAVTDASIKNGKMGGSQVMSNMNKIELFSNQLYHKY